MTYNIHPLLVHFPIAFLLLYSVLIILPLDRWLAKVSWRHVRQVLLFVGVVGALLANLTGETAQYIVRPNRQIVDAHAFFALASTWIYGLLLAGEVLFIVRPYIARIVSTKQIVSFFTFTESLLTNRLIVGLLSVLGIFAISLTGLLGGAMVYGASADPLAPIVIKLLGIQ